MKYSHPTHIPISQDLFFDWIGERVPCSSKNTKGDTYPVTWADDDVLYAGAGDPLWYVKDGENHLHQTEETGDEVLRAVYGLVVESFTGEADAFQMHRINDMPAYIGWGGWGPKPTGMICVDGKLYFAVQNLFGHKPPRFRTNSQHGSDATILCSTDHGKTWQPDLDRLLRDFTAQHYDSKKNEMKTPDSDRQEFHGWQPMFPGSLFGGPSFVQFGKNNRDAVDDYVYAISADHWDNGRDLRLGRVPKGCILSRNAWEFAVPQPDGGVNWTKDLEASQPILEIDRHISAPEMVYVKSLQKYLLCTWALHTDFRTPTGSELTILESDAPWGPFSLVHYEWMWYKREACHYTPRIPQKWFDQDTLTGYLLASGNWENQFPYYQPQVRKFQLTVRTDDCRGESGASPAV